MHHEKLNKIKNIYLAKWIVRIINNDHLCSAVEFARQLHWIKFPVSTGNDTTLLTLHKQVSLCYSSVKLDHSCAHET